MGLILEVLSEQHIYTSWIYTIETVLLTQLNSTPRLLYSVLTHCMSHKQMELSIHPSDHPRYWTFTTTTIDDAIQTKLIPVTSYWEKTLR